MRNFIISSDQIDGNKIRCSASEQKHITTVLRMQQGDQVRFLDDNGNYYIATLQYVDENMLMKTKSLLRLSIKGLILQVRQASLSFKH